jgi:hypothetical protein
VKKIIYLSGLAILLILIILLPFLIHVGITCQSQYGECPLDLTNKLSSINGKSLTVAKRESKKVLSSSLLVSNYSFQFKLPNTLQVELIIKKPIFALKNQSSNSFSLIDKDGTVLTVTENTVLPVLSINEDTPGISQKINDKYLFALNIINGLFKMYQIRGGVIQNDTLLVDLPGQVRVIFPLVGKDYNLLLGSLRLIYSNIQSTEGGNLYKEVDMRYENPVLR